ncbi:MAG TPA: hypothetical protein VGX02_04945, partial [Candidatus Eremiobacteraceae bacterium]|nr:hypothetical protein [Candidatus Eremiobacteraceae bacterium]
ATRATALLAIGAGVLIGAKILRRGRPGSVPLGDEDDDEAVPDGDAPSGAPDPGPPQSPTSGPPDGPLGEDEVR